MMTFVWTIAMLALVQQAQPGPFDRPMGELRGEKSDDPLDRMSLNQMMRMAALPAERLRELQCAGVASWAGSRAWPAFALSEEQRGTFVDRVTVAFAHDLEVDKALASDLIAKFAEEPPHREQKGELPAYRAEMEKDCGALLKQVRSGDYALAPLAAPSVVDTTLATCYVRYTLAAEKAARATEAADLRKTAAKAEQMALAGKQDAALNAARAALSYQLAQERGSSAPEDEQDMMRLVMCLPAIEAAGAKRQ